ncbi:alkaline shock response membrane anchor protein AmaP [Cetobacterium sp. 2A]|uniref:alkaline shock response membrane anchor protein AmaP n=1 Tax=Cetobacterium sp. 2A TaxID=2754723 RepID=UPI0021030259|nr:alkaline shock response membrane anchor protein AmaP [Cetobacterium sp. 2A]
MWKKVVFFLAWVGIFLLSIIGISYIIMPSYFVQVDTTSLIFKFTALNICLVYFFISLLKLLSNFSKKDGYTIKNENGIINISSDSVRNLLKEVLSRDHDVKAMKIESGKRGSKFYVSVTLEILSNANIADKTVAIQNSIKEELRNKLDLNVDIVEVKISKLSIRKDSMV